MSQETTLHTPLEETSLISAANVSGSTALSEPVPSTALNAVQAVDNNKKSLQKLLLAFPGWHEAGHQI